MKIPATFDRLEGVPQIERRPYNLIVEGNGAVLLSKQDGAGPDVAQPRPRSQIARRYMDGARLLAELGLGGAGPASPEAEKPSVVLLKSQTARSLTVVFSGNNPEFALPAHLLFNHDTHLMLIHDRRRCFALAGIPGLGADYASCLASLRRIIDSLRPDNVFVLGISAGGAGAIKFACDLPAQRLLCFSVPTTLRLEDDSGATLARYPQLARLYRHDRNLGIDLAAYYAAQDNPPLTTLIYSAGHPRDAWLAQRMAGLPDVKLVPTEGYTGHTTYRWLVTQSAVGSYLDTLYVPSGGMAPGLAVVVSAPQQSMPPAAPDARQNPFAQPAQASALEARRIPNAGIPGAAGRPMRRSRSKRRVISAG